MTDADRGQVFLAVRDGDELELHLAAQPDLLAVCSGNVLDGGALLADLRDGVTPPPLDDSMFAGSKTAIQDALDGLDDWATAVFGTAGLGTGEPQAWRPERQEFAVELLATTTDGELRYQIQTPVPDNWIPLIPVTVDATRGDVALERGTIYGEWGQLVEPKGRLLAALARPREEELPKQGLRTVRRAHRTRWTDGSTHLWFARQAARRGRGCQRAPLRPSRPHRPDGLSDTPGIRQIPAHLPRTPRQ